MNQVKKVTLADVAYAAGVSRTTASYILGKTRGGFAEETVERVVNTAKQLGFRPSAIARGLRTGRTKLLGFLSVADAESAFPVIKHQLELGVALEARKHGMDIVKVLMSPNVDSEIDRIRDLVETRLVECLVLENTPMGSNLLPSLQSWGAIFVVVGNPYAPGIYTVDTDNVELGRTAARHLISYGHKHLAFLAPPEHWIWANERVEGFMSACKEAEIEPTIMRNDITMAGGYECMHEILRSESQITGVWAANDHMAHGAITAATEAGLTVPDDISVVGSDNDPYVRIQPDLLSTIDLGYKNLGSRAARKAIALIEGKTVAQRELGDFEFLARRSSGPAKNI